MVPKAKLGSRKYKPARKPEKQKKRKKGLFSRVMDEAWDVIEDVFD